MMQNLSNRLIKQLSWFHKLCDICPLCTKWENMLYILMSVICKNNNLFLSRVLCAFFSMHGFFSMNVPSHHFIKDVSSWLASLWMPRPLSILWTKWRRDHLEISKKLCVMPGRIFSDDTTDLIFFLMWWGKSSRKTILNPLDSHNSFQEIRATIFVLKTLWWLCWYSIVFWYNSEGKFSKGSLCWNDTF